MVIRRSVLHLVILLHVILSFLGTLRFPGKARNMKPFLVLLWNQCRAVHVSTCEVICILKTLFDLGIKSLNPMSIFCDNESAIKLVLNPVFHEKTKIFDVDTHFIKDHVSKGVVEVFKVDYAHNIADIFTKSMGDFQNNILCERMGFKDLFQGKF